MNFPCDWPEEVALTSVYFRSPCVFIKILFCFCVPCVFTHLFTCGVCLYVCVCVCVCVSPQRQVSGELQMQPQTRPVNHIAMTMATLGLGMSCYSARQMAERVHLKEPVAWDSAPRRPLEDTSPCLPDHRAFPELRPGARFCERNTPNWRGWLPYLEFHTGPLCLTPTF